MHEAVHCTACGHAYIQPCNGKPGCPNLPSTAPAKPASSPSTGKAAAKARPRKKARKESP